MNWLISTDLHLSDRPKDNYRFGLFQWLAKQQVKHNVTATFILGDLTQDKDKHSSALVNRIIDELMLLPPPVYILRGNHDGISEKDPFFRFINCIDGLRFVVEPKFLKSLGVAMVPHCRTQTELDAACGKIPPNPEALFTHVTFEGAIAESGARLSGLRASPIDLLQPRLCLSGDVHKPQRCGPVTYVGAPYHVRFGDQFNPRVLLVKNGREQDLHFDCPRKWALTVKGPQDLELNEDLKKGDQVKLTLMLNREDAIEWAARKQALLNTCKELGLEVFGASMKVKDTGLLRVPESNQKIVTPTQTLSAFCQAEKLAKNVQEAGEALLEG